MKKKIVQALERYIYNLWYLKKDKPLFLYRFFSCGYRLVVYLRRLYLTSSHINRTLMRPPVIIVGNIVAGGAGKTPFVIWLVKYLQTTGVRVGVVSKGYGRLSKALHVVQSNSLVENVGDEALLIHRATQAPVVVDKSRLNAIQCLKEQFNVQVIVCDDGLQDYRVARTLEIVLYDAYYGFGNGYCLPAGPLREPISRLKQTDFVLQKVTSPIGLKVNQFYLQPKQWVNVFDKDTLPLAYFKHKVVHAVTGIAHCESFFRTLESLGIKIIRHAFSDHHAFVASDFLFKDKHTILMTAKDAVKCQYLIIDNAWYLDIDVVVDNSVGINVIKKAGLIECALETLE